MSRDRIKLALEQIKFARKFTSMFLDDLKPEEWFWQPNEGVTHIAWQVGHLATSQYALCLRRQRGRLAADQSLVSDDFLERFGKNSAPNHGAENNPAIEDIRRVFHGVFEQSLAELSKRTDKELDVVLEESHPVFTTKLGAIQWCSGHELVHSGQIALLRRLMGKVPLR